MYRQSVTICIYSFIMYIHVYLQHLLMHIQLSSTPLQKQRLPPNFLAKIKICRMTRSLGSPFLFHWNFDSIYNIFFTVNPKLKVPIKLVIISCWNLKNLDNICNAFWKDTNKNFLSVKFFFANLSCIFSTFCKIN